ncbi:Protein slowmo like protein 2 [Atta colombica]|uniref:Protein slowmo like protein 2 n=1 Tax=Atta colombica TaxID=520822 RepID=A0A195B962_9HYME|nr:Protein slowmo like protein 2 [Atta colombica]
MIDLITQITRLIKVGDLYNHITFIIHTIFDANQFCVSTNENTLTFGNYIAVDEAVRYTPHPDDPTKTLLTQEAVVTVRGVPLTNYMEDLLASKISFNASKVSDLLMLRNLSCIYATL